MGRVPPLYHVVVAELLTRALPPLPGASPAPPLLPALGPDSGERPGVPALRAAGGTTASGVVLPWLVRLRWGAVTGQTLTVLFASVVLGCDLPLILMGAVIAFAATTNLLLAFGLLPPRLPERPVLGAVLTLDTLLLTALLALSGGPHNPFGVLYVLHVAMAAVVLSAGWTWWTVGLSAACYGLLFAKYVPLTVNGADISVHLALAGSWCAVTLVSGVTAVFIERVAQALRRREEQLHLVRELAERNERLASLTTLAAGAAHELGTPLGTIAVVARELERTVERLPRDGADLASRAVGLVEDARLVRAEVDRCRRILDRMGTQAERSVVSTPERTTTARLLSDLQAELPPGVGPLKLDPSSVADVVVPRNDLVQALAPLCTNALDAQGGVGPVLLTVSRRDGLLTFEVKDTGHGMAADVLARASEPFYTTKPPGRGTGLGLYLVRLLGERLGGRLRLASQAPGGTTATFEVPEQRLPESSRDREVVRP